MIELNTTYKSGQRTYVYLLIRHGWWLIAIIAGLLYLAYSFYFGRFNASATSFFAAHSTWGVDVTLLTQWTLMFVAACLLILFMRISVLYRQYSFYVDDDAFHLRRGLIRIHEITIPYRQISNVHIEQPYHWRLFGLCQLDIMVTSSREDAVTKKRRDFLVPCMDKSLAKALSHFLVAQASGENSPSEEEDEYEDEEDGEEVAIIHT